MPKYYVKSGDIKYIIDSNDPESAILAALYYYRQKPIITGSRICVSETGFENFKNWKCYNIDDFKERKSAN
jgi:hypothetical protein